MLGTIAIVLSLLLPGVPVFIRVARPWSWTMLWACGVDLAVERPPGFDPRRPCLYMANHQSLLDIPALTVATHADLKFVTKRELLFIPIFGWSLWCAGFIFVDRSRRDRAIRSMARGAQRLRKGASVLAFPEGTRSPTGELLPFKKGAFMLALESGAPIVPVRVDGGAQVLPKKSLRIRPGRMRIRIGTPIETRGMTVDDRDRLMALVRERLENAGSVASQGEAGCNISR